MAERVIWKYSLEIVVSQDVQMPEGATLVHVAAQYDGPCVWALVEPEGRVVVNRRIYIHGTGHWIMDPIATYVGSFMLQNGAFVGHVFDGGETHV